MAVVYLMHMFAFSASTRNRYIEIVFLSYGAGSTGGCDACTVTYVAETTS